MDSNHHEVFSQRTLCTLWSTHYPSFIRCSSPSRQEGMSANFNTLHYAEKQGFEPQIPFSMPVFKTGAFNHSAISPFSTLIIRILFRRSYRLNYFRYQHAFFLLLLLLYILLPKLRIYLLVLISNT